MEQLQSAGRAAGISSLHTNHTAWTWNTVSNPCRKNYYYYYCVYYFWFITICLFFITSKIFFFLLNIKLAWNHYKQVAVCLTFSLVFVLRGCTAAYCSLWCTWKQQLILIKARVHQTRVQPIVDWNCRGMFSPELRSNESLINNNQQ